MFSLSVGSCFWIVGRSRRQDRFGSFSSEPFVVLLTPRSVQRIERQPRSPPAFSPHSGDLQLRRHSGATDGRVPRPLSNWVKPSEEKMVAIVAETLLFFPFVLVFPSPSSSLSAFQSQHFPAQVLQPYRPASAANINCTIPLPSSIHFFSVSLLFFYILFIY